MIPERVLVLSAYEDNEKMNIHESVTSPLPDIESAGKIIVGFIASTTMRSLFLLFTGHRACGIL